ncbi:hypothetical protein T08_3587 [Trichinella sp. T8]|nr:hypothetical protein T08_3587 [Trichinella sp. T8]
MCYDGPFWDDARLRHGDATGVLELECRPSTVGGSVGVRGTPYFGSSDRKRIRTAILRLNAFKIVHRSKSNQSYQILVVPVFPHSIHTVYRNQTRSVFTWTPWVKQGRRPRVYIKDMPLHTLIFYKFCVEL